MAFSKAEYLSIATIVGTVIGAGIFGLPFIAARAGFGTATFYIVALGGMTVYMHLLYAEIVLRTKAHHFLPGLAAKYLGRWGKPFTLGFIVPGLLGTLLAYGVVGGLFLEIILGDWLPWGNAFIYGILFSLAGVFIILGRIKLLADFELGVVILLILTIIGITLGTWPYFDATILLTPPTSTWAMLLPYGAVLFAVSGFESIPEVREIFEATKARRHFSMRRAIVIGTLIPLGLYIVFMAAVYGVTGGNTSEEALQGLMASAVPQSLVKIAALFGLLATASSYLVMADNLKKIFWYDLNFSRKISWLLVLVLVVVLYLINKGSFVALIGFIGALAGGFGGLTLLLIHSRARRQGDRQPEFKVPLPRALAWALGALFVVGALYQLWLLIYGWGN